MIAKREPGLALRSAKRDWGPALRSAKRGWEPALRSAKREGGFTLLEVIVALAILAAGLLGLIELLSGSLRLAGGARDSNAASLYASQRLEEAMLAPSPAEGEETGLFGEKYRWTARTSFLPEEEGRPYRPVHVQVTVRWDDGGRDRAVSVSATRWERKRDG
ncbi:MAG: prepilin-type N-terminal cleavage/methylation domain-containing protein [Deltaproteobacteria bacterium]|nr:prepilin-type N-terminal cleavage/methylation domain-containing protein [Deltaproteobacteria bacterium]